jgi:hypothetical protein
MKKLLILAFALLLVLPLLGQSRVVEVARITETTTPPTVTFRVYWEAEPDNQRHRDSVWVFVDYQTVDNAGVAGSWTAATLTTINVSPPGTLSTVTNWRGFYVKGTSSTFSSTVTVALDGLTPAGTKFNWCAYASDYPPNATENNNYYDLHGSPPFVINGNITETSKTYTGGCIEQLTDATGCPGEVPTLPEVIDFTASASSVCAGSSVTLSASANSVTTEFSFDGGVVWLPATPAGTATVATASVAPATNTAYTVHVRSWAGCTATSTVTHPVTVHPLPAATFSNAPATACAGTSVTVVASGGGSYCFTHTCSNCVHNPYTTGNDLSTEVDCDMSNTSCTYSASNSYTLTMPESGSLTVWVKVVNDFGCMDSTSTVIESIPCAASISLPLGSADRSLCDGEAMTLTYATTAGVLHVAYSGLPAGLTTVWGDNDITISGTPTQMGTFPYTITVTGLFDSNSATGTITVKASPTIATNEPADQSVCSGTAATLTVTAKSGETYTWYHSGGSLLATGNTYSTGTAGGYYVVATNADGCTTTSRTATVTVNYPGANGQSATACGCAGNLSNCSGTCRDCCDGYCESWTACGFSQISTKRSEGIVTHWSAANAQCQNKGPGWRLPTLQELECMCSYPVPSGFETAYYWSSTLSANSYGDPDYYCIFPRDCLRTSGDSIDNHYSAKCVK